MKHPVALEVYERHLAPSELKWMTGQFAINITIRLHAMIFSFGMKTPVVAINYSYLEPAELKWLAGHFLFNITVRLRAMIFSARVQGICKANVRFTASSVA